MLGFMRWWLWVIIAVTPLVEAAIDVHTFETQSQRQRYHALIDELRCPKCQNQNLSGSNSQIAQDLRNEVHRLLVSGQSNTEIKQQMVARYGEFVLYKPLLKASTLVLWLLPLLLLVIALMILGLILRQRRQQASASCLSESEQAALDALLKNTQESQSS
ncbi:MAG: cytochrome c-type biogenesis protein CcmH [Cellvibrionaceae bacterium]|nr:cytochrome c-type biogenesis protein CcmH [Cellvibrionaceae bacterium]